MTPFEQILWSDPIKTLVIDDTFAKQLYAALCNVLWKHSENEEYGCTWRYAGEIVADLRDKGEDYMDFYFSGNEGVVHENISKILLCYGWTPHKYP